LVVILGTTGVGKTKLGIQIAKEVNGEVVNVDALQMYRGLSIATAKATEEEMDGVRHHMMSFLEPTEAFTPHDFCKRAEPVIEDIRKRGKVPVLVGGTLYYIQSLLWDNLIEQGGGEAPTLPTPTKAENPLSSLASGAARPGALWEALNKVDPAMAQRLHRNNTRKIERSLEVFHTTGKRHSDLIKEQALHGGGVGGVSAYDFRLVWLYAEKPVLERRLEERVDGMVAEGLAAEVRALHRAIVGDRPGEPIDWNQGVLQAIGFKEFKEYLDVTSNVEESVCESLLLDDRGEHAAALSTGATRLKLHTKRYARKQIKWIKNRLVRRGVKVHMLDTSDVGQWDTNVLEPATVIVQGLFSEPSEEYASTVQGSYDAALRACGNPGVVSHDPSLRWKKYYCDVCEREVDGAHEWEVHLKTKAHRRNARRKDRQGEGERKKRAKVAETEGEE
jgi:tRNA dimethylallyltransferase